MAGPNWNSQRSAEELTRLLAPGVLGFFTHFEATEVFASAPGQPTALNVFSIFVAEERLVEGSTEPEYLTSKPIRLKSLDGWSFGIKRYLKPVAELAPLFRNIGSQDWRPAGQLLRLGELVPVPTQFIAPDLATPIPLNRVLKNNFWSGSHVLEWADPNKTPLKPLLDEPRRLKDLSDAVRPLVPFGLASLSDRLGNLIVQLPVTILVARFGHLQASGDMLLTVQWHPKATQRPLRTSCTLRYDGAISATMSASAAAPQTVLPMADGPGAYWGTVWDDEHRILLGASEDFSFIASAEMAVRIADPEPRVFFLRDESGAAQQIRVPLMNPPIKSLVGKPVASPAGQWTSRRVYREETDRLAAELRFVQYLPDPGNQRATRTKALRDIRLLINRHGEESVWLWDPFLSAEDVLNTLFYCGFIGSDLRALSGGSVPLADRTPPPYRPAANPICAWVSRWLGDRKVALPPRPSFAATQRAKIEEANSNLRGLRLEYRVKTASSGWDFHDRFLIFPRTDGGTLAWSLGTSINSLGKRHHILQRVDDGERIRDAFLDLWDELDQTENLIWKT